MTGEIDQRAGRGRMARPRALALALGLAIAAVLLGLYVEPASGATHAKPVFRITTKQKIVALSFDDGPDPRWTPQMLALLAKYGAHATFFEIGNNALAHRDLVASVLANGNEIGNHTLDHPHLPSLSGGQITTELAQGSAALVAAGAPQPTLFRPPLGLRDDRVLDAAASQKLQLVLWTGCVEHYVNHNDVGLGVRRMLRDVRPGAILLAHDGGIPDRSRTMDAMPMLLDGLAKRGYKIVTVSELLALQNHKPA